MDITNESLKSMKAKQLRRLIREAITEVLNETTVSTTVSYKGNKPDKILKVDPSDTETIANIKTDPTIDHASMGDKKIKEGDLEELARIAKGFRLANPEIDSTTFTKTISGTPLSSIIDYFRENPGAEKTQMQAHFGFVRPQIANAIVNGLLDAGILVKLGAGGAVETTPEPGEEQPEDVTGPEALFIGGGNPLAQYFDDEPNADGTEDFNNDEEPTVGDVEPGIPASAGGMSDEDYEAFLKYSELRDRLAATKSNLLKVRRGKKGGMAGDIADRPSNEEQRLRDLKKSLEDRVNALVAGSEYLQKKVEKETGKAYEPIEPEETEEDTIDEAFDAEYERRKLQYYAGIIK